MSEQIIFTVGHSNHDEERFGELLKSASVRQIVDVRILPRSRRYAHFSKENFSEFLRHLGYDYEWMKSLGGYRLPAPDSPHHALGDGAERGYADYMQTEKFREAIVHLLELASMQTTVFVCAEGDWRQCHRRFIADYLELVVGTSVLHLLPDGHTQRHPCHRAARRSKQELIYDVHYETPLFP